uniref:Uncharacterized protein n=1 Tax=Romanomermis culicivorax TaxID=13658 RepID=A0A915L3K2_ROMCU
MIRDDQRHLQFTCILESLLLFLLFDAITCCCWRLVDKTDGGRDGLPPAPLKLPPTPPHSDWLALNWVLRTAPNNDLLVTSSDG